MQLIVFRLSWGVGFWLVAALSDCVGVVSPTLAQIGTEIKQPARTIAEWRSQIAQSLVEITAVQLNQTETGLEVVLETPQGEILQPVTLTLGKTYIANIPNAILALPQGEFRAENPASGITRVRVTQATTNSIRVTVTGQTALPTVELYDSPSEGLIFSFTPGTSAAQTPPAPADDETIEILVTGEQDGYRLPDTSVGTRTDTPLRDIPQSIQIVPQQVLEDRQVRSIIEGLENVSGVYSSGNFAGGRDYFVIRGFEAFNSFVNGLPDPQVSNDGGFLNVERLEVLRGPASVLYGDSFLSSLGGTVNLVTKQPLRDPFYEISATIGSFNEYQGAIDLTGPLNDSRTVLYRFIGGYLSNDTFVDFNEGTELFIAPSLSFSIGQNTDLIVEGDVSITDRNGTEPEAIPAVGTVLPNPNGRIPRSFSGVGPVENTRTINSRIGYRLEHRFNENLRLRNAFRYLVGDSGQRDLIFPLSLADDNRTLNRELVSLADDTELARFYYLDTNLLGQFSTGSVNHQLLFGFSLSRTTDDLRLEFGNAAPVDIFDPVYDNTIVTTGIPDIDRFTTRDTLGVYLQDQITIAENLKLLLGGRVDFFEERQIDRLLDERTTQSDTAFSPRVGIVYQPIQLISLYASYSRAFTPTIGQSADGEAFRPGRGTQYEVGIRADINDQLSANLAFYDLTRTNVTTDDPDNPSFSVQTGEQRSRGIELDISGEILPGWNIIGGYAYTDARVTEDNLIPEGNRFGAPEHAINLWTTYRIQAGDLQGLGFGLGFYYAGETAANLANTFEIPSYFRTDAAIFYERDQFRAAVNFRNLFNVDYYKAAGSTELVTPGEPFTVQGTISWQF
ncbi:TonB-dependent siderophore receptor [Gloeocapsopsis sp. IPPAS B-1203]|nr:TonB-dependent siderophore receptor [Gloeocapsopsis sp. IPPAS B-1203]